MITYFVRRFSYPIFVTSSDRFQLIIERRGEKEIVHSQNITCSKVLTHWAYLELPGIGAAYFVGNEKLAEVLVERFPDAVEKEENLLDKA
jgi:hypothetical protein